MTATETALAVLTRALPDHVDDALMLLDEQGVEKLALFAEPAAAYIAKAQAIAKAAPTSDAEEAVAVEVLNDGVRAVKELDDLRKKHVGPLNEQVKAINALFARLTGPIEALTETRGPLERVILAWREVKAAKIRREQEEARRKQEEAARKEAVFLAAAERAKTADARAVAMAKAQEASQAQAQALVEAPRDMTKGTRTESGSVTATERWTFEVLDPAYVPREYLTPDLKAIGAAVKAGVRVIQGVSIYPEGGLIRRPGR